MSSGYYEYSFPLNTPETKDVTVTSAGGGNFQYVLYDDANRRITVTAGNTPGIYPGGRLDSGKDVEGGQLIVNSDGTMDYSFTCGSGKDVVHISASTPPQVTGVDHVETIGDPKGALKYKTPLDDTPGIGSVKNDPATGAVTSIVLNYGNGTSITLDSAGGFMPGNEYTCGLGTMKVHTAGSGIQYNAQRQKHYVSL